VAYNFNQVRFSGYFCFPCFCYAQPFYCIASDQCCRFF